MVEFIVRVTLFLLVGCGVGGLVVFCLAVGKNTRNIWNVVASVLALWGGFCLILVVYDSIKTLLVG